MAWGQVIIRKISLAAVTLGCAGLVTGCVSGQAMQPSTLSATDAEGLVVLQLVDPYAGQPAITVTIAGYDEEDDALLADRVVSASSPNLGAASNAAAYYRFKAPPGTYLIRDIYRYAGGQVGLCFSQGTVAFDVAAGGAIFVGRISHDLPQGAPQVPGAYEYSVAKLKADAGDMLEAASFYEEAVATDVPLRLGAGVRAAVFDVAASPEGAIGLTCERAQSED